MLRCSPRLGCGAPLCRGTSLSDGCESGAVSGRGATSRMFFSWCCTRLGRRAIGSRCGLGYEERPVARLQLNVVAVQEVLERQVLERIGRDVERPNGCAAQLLGVAEALVQLAGQAVRREQRLTEVVGRDGQPGEHALLRLWLGLQHDADRSLERGLRER